MKRTLQKVLAAALALTMAIGTLTACGGGNETKTLDGTDTIVLVAGHGGSEDYAYHKGLVAFKEQLEIISDGKMTVVIHPNATLGNERDLLEGLQLGSVDICVVANGTLTTFVPSVCALDLPYLFEDTEHVRRILASDILNPLKQDMVDQGFHSLAFWENGFRSLANSKRPINTIADCKGLKIRTLDSKVMIAGFNAIGCEVVTMGMSEVFTAAQNGTIDGMDQPLNLFASGLYYEVQDYLSLTEMYYPVGHLLLSQTKYNSLSDEQQEWVDQAAQMSRQTQWDIVAQETKDAVVVAKEHGVQVIENVDKTPFKEATKVVYDQYAGDYDTALVQSIQSH